MFQCDECRHLFEASLNSISNMKSWCPTCKNKTQRSVSDFLRISPYPVEFDKSNTPHPNGTYRIDWLIHTPRGPVALELDGGQHFKEVKAWGGADALAVTQARDAYKMLYWLSRGARFIRLHQPDTLAGRFNWQAALIRAIDVSTDPVVSLEADPAQDSWTHLRAEIGLWWGRPVEEWLAANAERLNAPAADEEGPSPVTE
jgi:hypothetical protein